jgi:hypothetical protein
MDAKEKIEQNSFCNSTPFRVDEKDLDQGKVTT